MQVTVGKEEEEKEWQYPCLVIDEIGTIVLALKDKDEDKKYFEGVILKSNSYEISHGKSWYKAPCRLYKGSVTLRND
jgi:hypothetical protein